jgi:hypothetical protein
VSEVGAESLDRVVCDQPIVLFRSADEEMQDVVALNGLERRISVDPNSIEVNIKTDRGGLAARRMITSLSKAESVAQRST